MHRLGKVTLYIGIALVAIGLIVGFSAMVLDYDHQAKLFIGFVPIGFVLMLAGTVALQLTAPNANDEDEPK